MLGERDGKGCRGAECSEATERKRCEHGGGADAQCWHTVREETQMPAAGEKGAGKRWWRFVGRRKKLRAEKTCYGGPRHASGGVWRDLTAVQEVDGCERQKALQSREQPD